jgi:transposase
VGGYLRGVTSDRKIVLELHCNMALRWFVGLNLDQQPWDACQNRRRRFEESGILEQLFDETVQRAMAKGLVSRHDVPGLDTGRAVHHDANREEASRR